MISEIGDTEFRTQLKASTEVQKRFSCSGKPNFCGRLSADDFNESSLPRETFRGIQMSKSNPDNQSFDLEKLKQLIEMMEEHDVTEVNLRRGEEQWRLKRGSSDIIQYAPPPVPVNPAPPLAAASGPAAGESSPAVELGPTINAPTVGTFYTSASPDDPPFVVKGAKVTPETTVCLIEAMKVFNPIQADVTGTITEILVENGAAVEFGQPLFRYQPG